MDYVEQFEIFCEREIEEIKRFNANPPTWWNLSESVDSAIKRCLGAFFFCQQLCKDYKLLEYCYEDTKNQLEEFKKTNRNIFTVVK